MDIVFQSQAMLRVVQQARAFAAASASVLITGESGSGKELFARLLHEHSPRGRQPYVRINCAALAESLVESELFGHEAGAFTGATTRRAGKFEAAGRGTLFLDEISEVSPRVQAKLLRALEEAEYERVGGNEVLPVHARIIAASNRSLSELIDQGAFRADLFYRLDVLRLELPPLRERLEDIPVLAQHFIERCRHESPCGVRGCTAAALRRLAAYDWPGNVRQFRNVIHRACVIARGELLEEHDLSGMDQPTTGAGPDEGCPAAFTELALEEIERRVILARLQQYRGNKTAAAAALGVTSRTLRNKVAQYRRLGFAC